MANLTAEEAVQVRLYLGYDRYNAEVTSAATGLSAEAYAAVQRLLADLQALDYQLGKARQSARYEQVEEVRFAGRAGVTLLEDQGRGLVRRLAALLGLRVARDVFGGAVIGILRRG